MKVKNEKRYGILGTDYVAPTMSGEKIYKKGRKFWTKDINDNGVYIVEGHGIGHVIPRNLFTKFTCTWDEIEETVENGARIAKTTHHTKDETIFILNWFAKRDAKKNEKAKKLERRIVRNRIAGLRKTIKDAKTGKAEKELVECLDKLKTLK